MTADRSRPTVGSSMFAARRRREDLVVGAAIGTGMAANFAMRGGADFFIAINAGRIRSMGEPSLSAMLPTRESNRLVLEFGTREILPKATVPVLFGAATFDPRQSIDEILATVRSAAPDRLHPHARQFQQ